jgi:O-antigen/teichoic acid export membrane protein
MAVGLAELLAFRLDRYLVGVFLVPSAVGVYAAAAAAPELLRMPVATVAQPVFYRLAAGSATLADFRRTRQILLAATGAMVLVLVIAAPVAIRLAFGAAYQGAVTPLRVLLLAEFGVTLFYLDGSALAGVDRTRESAWAAMAGLFVTAVGDVVLIPKYGLAGAAWASVIGYSLMGAATHWFLRRQSRSPRPAR